MPIHLDVVCTSRHLTDGERRDRALQVIAEILPFVLAKHEVARQPPRLNGQVEFSRSPRFKCE